jgi:cytochrome c oxidase subunit 2
MMSLVSSIVAMLLSLTAALPPVTMHPSSQSSSFAREVDWVFWFVTWVSVFFFVLIVVVMVLFMVKYRRVGHVAATEGPTHNTPLEVTWSAIPLVIVIAMFYIGMKQFIDMYTPPQNVYEINVTAQKWQWTFSYANGAVTVNHLAVPANRPVRLIMQSQDVLHSLFIPAFRQKRDVVPGRVVDMWFEATQEGVYHLFCAEYCGTEHSAMQGVCEVLSDDELEVWLEEKAKWIDRVPDENLAAAGAKLYNRCEQCHSLDGSNKTGPSWKGLWDRTVKGETVFTDGKKISDLVGPGQEFETAEDYVRNSILVPQNHIVATFSGSMPTFKGQLKDREIMAITAFMKHLDEFVGPDGKLKPLPSIQELQESEASEGAAPTEGQ